MLSVAIVPVGVTQFRKESLKQVDKDCALQTIEIASKYNKVCCSDEFFILAEKAIPPAKYYGNFAQLEDGVGAIRMLLEDFKKLTLPKALKKPLKILFATSYAAKTALDEICSKLNRIKNLTAEVVPVKSNYWGRDITVAGLITTDDLIEALNGKEGDFTAVSYTHL